MKKVCAAAALYCLFFSAYGQSEIDPSRINIVRDQWGVPHIFAQTDAEVAYGLAWAHAEDDFLNIQKCFLASQSMLGLYTGREGATIDYIVHLLDIRDLVDSLYDDRISDPFKQVLEGYCAGLNAYARTHPKEIFVKKSFPVTPRDLLTYSVLQLAIGCGVETALKKIYNGTVPLAEWDPAGSNAMAFNSKITADGHTYLAINTHHPLESHVSWYEAHLSSAEGLNILGSLMPASPVILTGVNENLGWAHTVNHPDKLDIYQLEVDPANTLKYKVDDSWYTLEEKTVKLKMKVPGFNLHVKRKVYKSIYGPTVVTDRGVFAIRTGGLMDIRGLEQWYWMGKAKNYTQFRAALEMEAIPAYNIVYADKRDTIFYMSNGRIPIRQPGFDWKGTVPGNTSLSLWTRFHSVENLPQLLNPPSGYVFNANHSPFKATSAPFNIDENRYDPTMGFETHDNNRSLRFAELMEGKQKVGFDDFKRMKYDLKLPSRLAYPVNIDKLFSLEEEAHPEIADLIAALKKWDRVGTTDSHGAAIFCIFFYYVAGIYQRDETFTSMSEADCVAGLNYVKEYLLKHFGTTGITLGDYQRLERGDKSIPLPGLPDVLASMYSTPTDDGRVKGTVGDCYIALVRFTPEGPEIETINAFGASNRKGSPHFDDQMLLFQQQKTKRMTLDQDAVYDNAKTVYHPEVISRLPLSAKLNRGKR